MSKLVDYSNKFLLALASFVKSLVVVVLGIGLIALLLIEFFPICNASEQLLARLPNIAAIEVPGVVKLSLSVQAVAESFEALPEFAHGTATQKSKAALDKIKQLQPEEFVRLMTFGQLDGLCEFEKPSVEMRANVTLDYKLQELGLIVIKDDNQTSVAIQKEVNEALDRLVKEGNTLENGRPRACYQIEKLTSVGNDVKTALVQYFKQQLGHSREPIGPHPTNGQVAQR